MTLHRCLTLALAVCCSTTSWAGESSRILFSRLDESSGLASNSVGGVAHDLSGNSWFVTDQGLCKFDRFETQTFTSAPVSLTSISSNLLSTAVLGPEGELWVGTKDAGLNRFDLQTFEASQFVASSGEESISSNEITALAISEDQFLWIGTQNGLDLLHLKSMKFKKPGGIPGNSRITTILVVKKDAVWVGTEDGKLYQWKSDSSGDYFKMFWSTGAPISTVAYDSKRGLWVGTEGQGLFKLDPATAEAEPANIAERDITALRSDSNGDLWVGTRNGLGRVDRGSGDFTFFQNDPSDRNSLAHNYITSIREDQAKVLWITTNGGGVSRFGLNRYWLPHFRKRPGDDTQNQLPHNSVWGMAPAADDSVWLGTERGITRFDPATQSYQTPELSELFDGDEPYVYSIHEAHNGDIWCGTKGEGLLFLPAGRVDEARIFRHDPDDPSTIGHDFVTCIYKDLTESIWFGTNGRGMWHFDSSINSFIQIPAIIEEGVRVENSMRISSISDADKKGDLWVGTSDGLFYYSNKNGVLTHFRELNPVDYRFPSEDMSVVHYGGDNSLFVGTRNAGLCQYIPATGKTHQFTKENSGLPDNTILGILEQNDRFIWVSTGNGIAVFDIVNDIFRVFDETDGIQSRSLHIGSVARTQNGMLFFGGTNGFHKINPDPKELPKPRQPAQAILTSFEYFGEKVIPKKGGILEKELGKTSVINIPYDERSQIAFRFGNLDSEFPEQGQFRYQLVDFDIGWIADEKRTRRANYQALRPGRYEFQVQSSSDGRLWNPNLARVNLVVTPPWYSTWWARLLFLLTSLTISLSIVRLMVHSRLKQIERREEQLTAQRDRSEAALSKELQNAVLLDRTTRDFRHDLRGDAIFKTPLQNLGEHFKASRCLLRITQQDLETGATQLVTVAQYCADGVNTLDDAFGAPEVITDAILNSQDAVACEFLDSNPEFAPVAGELHKAGVRSFLASRTNFLDQANGILIVHQCDRTRAWTENESKLLKSVASQFGNAIAQRDLTLKEEKYRNELENARHNAEVANAAKSDFLAKMTHELRTPLNAIIGFSQVIRDDEMLGDRQREIIDIINHSGEHLLDVINDILDVSKIEAGKAEINLEQFELAPLLHSVREMLGMKAEIKGIGFELSNRSRLPKVIETDRSKLRQVLINLLGNGLKFTDRGAIGLTVAAEAISDGKQNGNQWRRKIRIHFQVRDTGRGIAQHELPRLFEKFAQTDTGRRASEGSGLGLPIAKNFVNMLGGDIEVMSKLGFGTMFQFSIDCEEISEPGQTTTSEISMERLLENKNQQIIGLQPDTGEVRILIAEDQPVNRLLLKKVLSKAGFALEEAINGREAYEKWQQWKPHLILMDEDMPIMKGSEATVAILNDCPKTEAAPVIITLTAYAFEQAREKALSVGCSDFISKPFKARELYATIAKHLKISYKYAPEPPPKVVEEAAIV